MSPASPALQVDSTPLSHLGSPSIVILPKQSQTSVCIELESGTLPNSNSTHAGLLFCLNGITISEHTRCVSSTKQKVHILPQVLSVSRGELCNFHQLSKLNFPVTMSSKIPRTVKFHGQLVDMQIKEGFHVSYLSED